MVIGVTFRACASAAALALIGLVMGCGGVPDGQLQAPASAGLPEVVPVTVDELRDDLARRNGRVVLVNVWATWCVPCREEFPDLLRLREEFGPRGFDLVLVSADFAAQLDNARSFLAEQGVDFETFHKRGRDQEFIDGLDPRWSGALPASFLMDRSGLQREFWEGKVSFEQLAPLVEALLAPSV